MSAPADHETYEAQVQAYFDGALTADEEPAVLEHLADCARCQSTLDDLMGLQVALGRASSTAASAAATASSSSAASSSAASSSPASRSDGDAARTGTTRNPPVISLESRRSRRGWIMAGVAAAVAAAAAIVVVPRLGSRPRATDSDDVAYGDTRPVEVRFTARGFGDHRPYRVERGTEPVKPLPLSTLSALERRGDKARLLAALVWSGDQARAATVAATAGDDPRALSDRAAVDVLRGDPEAALEAADRALIAAPDLAAARWNRALALRDLGFPLAAAGELDTIAAAREPGWADEAAERARALRQPVEARRAARLDAEQRRVAALTGGPPLTAADVAIAPTTARQYFHDALRVAASIAELDALAPLAAALDQQSGGDECARALARVRSLDLSRRARFVPRYRELAARKLSPAQIEAFLAALAAAGPVVDDLRLGAIVLGRKLDERLADVDRLAAATGNPWFVLLAVQGRAAQGRPREGDGALAEQLCSNPAWALRCAAIDQWETIARMAQGRFVEAERLARRNVERLVVGSTGREEEAALLSLSGALRAHGRFALAAAALTESLGYPSTDDCAYRKRIESALAELARLRGDAQESRAHLADPDQCLAGVDVVGVATAVDLARDTGDPGDRAMAERWIAAGHAAREAPPDPAREYLGPAPKLPVDYLHAAMARLTITEEAGAREVLLDVAQHPPEGDFGPAIADWAWRTLIADDGRRGDWNGAFQRTLAALGQEQPATCAITLASDDAIHTVAWRDSNGTTGGAQWREPAAWPALPPSALYGCAKTQIVALSPMHGRPPPWKLGVWAWSSGRVASASANVTADRLVVAATEPPHELLDLPNLAPVAVPPGARGLTGSDATPSRVAAALAKATYVEIHAHGLVDLDTDDGGFVALSPDAGGDWKLTGSDVRKLKLAGAPVVVLAACRAAEAGPLSLRRWSFPDAFLAAGARAVIAADVAVPDDLIRAFVDDVRARLEQGEEPAKAAAAARAALIAKDATSASWVDRLMVFE